jgi:multimeric flavodoxin WrbA
MKVIAVLGSPKGAKGCTGPLVNGVLEGARAAGAETELFSLGDLSVLPCKGCQDVCNVVGKCHQKDDFEKIADAMLEADGIVFATPTYFFSVSAQLKALIDRLNLIYHCQRLNGKYGALVVTAGGSDPEDVTKYLSTIVTHFGFWKVGDLCAVRAQLEDAGENARLTEEAAALGKGMVDAIKNRQTFPEQEDERNQAFEIMKFMVMTLREEWPFAWDYWNTHWDLTEENP